jgi:hypothetical protein
MKIALTIKQALNLLIALAAAIASALSQAQEDIPEQASPKKAEGMIMLDYESIPVRDGPSIDLMGFHIMNKVNDWLYLGVGGYAPLVKGEYGGFMAFDVTAHAQRKVLGDMFLNAGVSAGGGGGGKSTEQSKVLSGTGGFIKNYVGLGYDFKSFLVGANYAKMKFTNSAINNTQFNAYVQFPFSYSVGSYASSGSKASDDNQALWESLSDSGENMLTLGLDNFFQIKPEGSNKGTINVADLQFSHYITNNAYLFFDLGVGYKGLPLYNQIIHGIGYRYNLSSQLALYGQLGIGSGGYAPEKINTGSGLLIYPKVSAEYLLNKNIGLALSGGYLEAPEGSSKNYTFGAAMNYHINPAKSNAGPASFSGFNGYRFNLSQQTEFDVKFKGTQRSDINMLSVQVDTLINDYIYVPIQASVAYNAYLSYPGYGEFLGGIGIQNKYDKDDRLQGFGQVLVGTNVHGLIVKSGLGLNYSLTDHLAIYGMLGQTIGLDIDKFKSNYAGLGLTSRFSIPNW